MALSRCSSALALLPKAKLVPSLTVDGTCLKLGAGLIGAPTCLNTCWGVDGTDVRADPNVETRADPSVKLSPLTKGTGPDPLLVHLTSGTGGTWAGRGLVYPVPSSLKDWFGLERAPSVTLNDGRGLAHTASVSRNT